MLKYQDVFVPGGFPRHTYNARVNLNLEARLGEIKDNLCKLVTITGQTKSGKTVLARKVLPPEQSIWIDGGSAGTEDEFWQLIVERLSLFQEEEAAQDSETTSGFEGKATAGADFFVAKGSGEIGAKLETKRGVGARKKRSVSSRVAALSGLKAAGIPLVIDDFHYLPVELQGKIVRVLKPLVFDGLPVAIIAIPHRRYDAVKVEREMAGRISGIEIPAWTSEELSFIPVTGYRLLGYELSSASAELLSMQAIGSPHLMQDFCRGLAKQRHVVQIDDKQDMSFAYPECEAVFRDVADTIGRPIFEKLARGPRQRTDRIQRMLRDGRSVDIYELVVDRRAILTRFGV